MGMFDAGNWEGLDKQRKETFVRRILSAFPERIDDVSLIYGDVELEYYRLINAGLLSDVDGIPGLMGPPGPPGDPGGPKGDKGDDGDPGPTPNISIGSTTTGNPGTNASVTKTGTITDPVFSFTIPRGAQGIQGIQGDPGPAGGIIVPDLISTIKYPFFVAHRGALALYPEHSMEAYENCVSRGDVAIEVDLQQLSDGTIVSVHDTTVTRTMNGISGNVNAKTVSEWRSARIKPAISGGREGTPAIFEEVLQRFGNRAVIVAELKVTANNAFTDAVAALIKKYGCEKSVIIQSFTYGDCTRSVTTHGLKALYLFSSTPAQSAATIKAAGIDFVGPSKSIASYTTYKTAGLKVIPYSVNTPTEWAAEVTKTADGAFSDSPWWIQGKIKKQSADPFREGFKWAGAEGKAYAGNFVWNDLPFKLEGNGLFLPNIDGTTTPSTTSLGGAKFVVQDWAGRLSYPLRLSATFHVSLGNHINDSYGFFLWNNTVDANEMWQDAAVPGQNGHTMVMRRSGQLQWWSYVNGASAVSEGASTAPATPPIPITGPGRFTVIVELTSTTITIMCPEYQLYFTGANTRSFSNMRLGVRGANNSDLLVTDVRAREII